MERPDESLYQACFSHFQIDEPLIPSYNGTDQWVNEMGKKVTPFSLEQKGITLLELLVALVICGIIIGGIYRLFIAQSKAYTVQDQVVEVQQNIRNAMEILLRDPC